MRTGQELVQQQAPWQRYLFGQWSVALIITQWLKALSRNGCHLSCQPQTLWQPDGSLFYWAYGLLLEQASFQSVFWFSSFFMISCSHSKIKHMLQTVNYGSFKTFSDREQLPALVYSPILYIGVCVRNCVWSSYIYELLQLLFSLRSMAGVRVHIHPPLSFF